MRVLLTICACGLLLVSDARATPPAVHHLQIEGVINPIKARYVKQALARARAQGAQLVLISLDTPGGLVSSMQDIVKSITNSEVPVIGLVEPSSAQATSAGAFILLATDVAAMLPDTRVGAAHPVGAGAGLDKTMDKKATNSLVSLAKTLAKRRGRSAKIAEAMVRDSKSYTAEEAKRKHAIDLIVRDRSDLWAQLDGYALDFHGRQRTLTTRGATLVEVPMSASDRLLDRVADPSIASILLTIGTLGILYEMAVPGIGLGGIVGVISLLVALLAMSVLPIQTAGVLLLAAGAVALAIEIITPTHGLLGAGGVAALVVGALVLVDETRYFGAVQHVDWRVILPVAAVLGTGFLMLGAIGRRALGAAPQTGVEALRGTRGVAKSRFAQNGAAFTGNVLVAGVRWQASADEPIDSGDPIEVVGVSTQPLRLRVARVANGGS